MGAEIRDAFDNVASAVTTTAIVQIASGPTGALLGGVTSRPFSSGAVSFTGLTLNRSGPYQLSVTTTPPSGSTITATTPSFTNAASSPAQAVIASSPPSTTAGVRFTVVAHLLDGFGNLSPAAATGKVSLASGPPGGGLGGTTLTVPFSGGVATFDTLTLAMPGTYQLKVTATPTAGGTFVATTPSFENLPGPPVFMLVTSQPSSTTAGSPFGLSAQLRDGFNNLATNATATAAVSIAAGPPGATLSGTSPVQVASGTATFTDLTVDRAGTYQVRVTATLAAGGTLTAQTSAFPNGPGPAVALAFTADLLAPTAGEVITPPVAVELRDAFSNLAISTVTAVSMSLDPNSAGATLSGTLIRDAVSGVASFDDLVISADGSGLTLRAAASGLTPAVSAPFTVTPAAAGGPQVTLLTVDPGDLTGAVPITFTLQDSTGSRADVAVEYQEASGGPFLRATQAGSDPGSGLDGVAGLSTSPSGTDHTFLWNSTADLGRTVSGVTLRVTPTGEDGTAGTGMDLGGLTVANGVSLAARPDISAPGVSVVDAVDLNGDGRTDLAAGNGTTGAVSFFFQDVGGTFSPGPAVGAIPTPAGIAAGDIFRQGSRSLAVTSSSTDKVFLLFNSAGFFFTQSQQDVGQGPVGVLLEDLNGDHKLDIATANSVSGTSR